MKVHCLFEQSGTFKNEFRKLGINAYDYDIQNEFNQTDYVIDLFKARYKKIDYKTDQILHYIVLMILWLV